MLDTVKMGRNGTLVIPATMRRRLDSMKANWS